MRCQAQLVTAYVDSELRLADREPIAAHVSECPWCAEQARQERALRLALRALPQPPLPARLRIGIG